MSAETVISKPGNITVRQATTSTLATCLKFEFQWPQVIAMTVEFTDTNSVVVKTEFWRIVNATRYLNANIPNGLTFIGGLEWMAEIIMNDVINNGTPTEGHNPDT